jgi:hypothetical protein
MKKQGRIFRFTPDEKGHIENHLTKPGYRQGDIQTVINGLEKICHYHMVSFSGKEKPSEHINDMKRTIKQIRRSHDALMDQVNRDHRHLTLEEAIVFDTDPADKIREKFDTLVEVSRLRVAHKAMQKQVVERIEPLNQAGGRPGADNDGMGYLVLSLLYRVLKTPRKAVCSDVMGACLEAVGLPSKFPTRRVEAARDMLAERGVSPIIDEKILF